MADPMTIMALLGGGEDDSNSALKQMMAISGIQGLSGLLQKAESAALRRRAKRDFQPYQIPSSAKAMLGKAESMATQRGIPGEDIYRQKAQASVAQGVEASQRTAQAPSDVLSVLQRLHGNYQDFEQNLATQGEQAYERRQNTLMNAMMRFSNFETERWQYNELYPYMQALGEAGQVDEAANQNIQSAVGSGMNIFGAKADMDFQREMQEDWKNMIFGENMGSPFDRTRKQEFDLRNYPRPQINTPTFENRKIQSPWVDPIR